MKTNTMIIAVLMLAAGSATANPLITNINGQTVQCTPVKSHTKKVPRKHKLRRPRTPHGAPAPCACQGTPGERGPKGDKGDAGITAIIHQNVDVVVHHYTDAKFPMDVGMFGTAMVGTGAWAWGPALQAGGAIADDYDLTLSLGLALGVADNQSGYQVRLGVNRDLDTVEKIKVQFTVGASYLKIDDEPKSYGAEFVTGDLGIVLARSVGPVNLKLNLLPVVLGGYESSYPGKNKNFDLGISGSLFASTWW